MKRLKHNQATAQRRHQERMRAAHSKRAEKRSAADLAFAAERIRISKERSAEDFFVKKVAAAVRLLATTNFDEDEFGYLEVEVDGAQKMLSISTLLMFLVDRADALTIKYADALERALDENDELRAALNGKKETP